MLFWTDSALHRKSVKARRSRERRQRVQLNLFVEIEKSAPEAEPWETLEKEERRAVVNVLARLMAKAVAQEGDNDEQ